MVCRLFGFIQLVGLPFFPFDFDHFDFVVHVFDVTNQKQNKTIAKTSVKYLSSYVISGLRFRSFVYFIFVNGGKYKSHFISLYVEI